MLPGRSLMLLIPLVMLVVGCDPGETSPESPVTSAADDRFVTMPAPWSDEGLYLQPRMTWLQQQTPPDMGYSPGTTGWRDADIAFRAEFTDPDGADYTTPGVLLHEWIATIGSPAMLGQDVWEYTARIVMKEVDTAIGVLLIWGLKDDAVAGHDIRVHMHRQGESWYIERIDERFHCRRAVTQSGLCL